jgi:hypothetical protein
VFSGFEGKFLKSESGDAGNEMVDAVVVNKITDAYSDSSNRERRERW